MSVLNTHEKTKTVYKVKNGDGKLVARHVRVDGPDGKKERLWWELPNGARSLGKMPLGNLPLYGSEQVNTWPEDDIPVVVAEGEKAAQALLDAGFRAVGTVTGANGTPGSEALEVLRGHEVVLWPDTDPVGQEHMDRIAERLQGVASKVRLYTWHDAPVVMVDGKAKAQDAADHPRVKNRFSTEPDDFLLNDLMCAPEWEPKPRVAPVGVMLSEVQPERVTWLWKNRIPKGKLTVVDGDPGNGKSAMTTDLAARVTAGHSFPDGSPSEPGGVVLMNAEDGLADTIRPRLDAAGGDVTKVLALATVPDADGNDRMLSVPEDIPIIERGIEQVNASLVVIDPLMAFLSGEVNAHKDQDVRRALAPLAKMAERTGAAVVVVRHLNKMSGGNAMYRGGGSIGIVGAARSGLVVAKDPDDESRRVLASLKQNLAQPAPSLTFTIATADNGAASVHWKGSTSLTADDVLRAPVDEEEKSALDEAKEFLRGELTEHSMASKQVFKDARVAHIADRTLKRAKAALHIKSEKEGDGSWTWVLPKAGGPDEGKGAREPLNQNPGPLGTLGTLDGTHHGSDGGFMGEVREGGQGCQGGQENHYGEHGTLDDGVGGEAA